MQESFEKANPGFVIVFKKLLPNDLSGSMYYSAPVKKLRLIKRNASKDLTDKYLGERTRQTIDFEVSLTAKRNGNLGLLASLSRSLKKDALGVITHEGISFGEAVAEIRVGGRTRRVGVFGNNSDAGVIDLTDVIVRGPNGHPTFASLEKESNALLKDFHTTVSGSGHEN